MVAAPVRLRRGEPASIADADLVARVRAGDRWAEDALYRRYARPVAGLVARLLAGTREEVEDVVHDAFVSAFEKIGRLRDASAFRAWLMQIAVTHVRRVLRRRRLKRALGLLPSTDELALERIASREASPEVRAELAVVDGVLRRLPADLRIAWVLRHVEGERLEDVAALCGCSLATAKRRIASAERAMRAVIFVTTEEGS
ncbi:MAG: sigma-70 family RNA polymerase sigma factor [Sandaracinaceae bacterium]|nr:sigma-70 family RNA polymerase sigma factor [Sandaracinaceae bacterium]